MPPKAPKTAQDAAILPGTGGTAVWASRDRYEAAERLVEDLKAENARLRRLLVSYDIDPATGTFVTRVRE
jgi:hypothetical protein